MCRSKNNKDIESTALGENTFLARVLLICVCVCVSEKTQ